MLGHHGITDPLPMLVYSLEEQVTTKGDKKCFFTAVAPSRGDVDPGQPRLVPHRIKKERKVQRLNLKIARDKGLVFRQTMSHAIVFNDSMPSDCLTTVVLCSHKILVLYQTSQSVPKVAPKVTF